MAFFERRSDLIVGRSFPRLLHGTNNSLLVNVTLPFKIDLPGTLAPIPKRWIRKVISEGKNILLPKLGILSLQFQGVHSELRRRRLTDDIAKPENDVI
jgi:hypothetical protein